tara:strand:- start:5178 stop:5564 length:387 start_codon:yes stop_codon:yes gene_type:complete
MYKKSVANILITNNAWDKLKNICNKENKNSFILSVTSGGCNGFNYNFNLLEKIEYDKLLKFNKLKSNIITNNNINIVIELKSEFLLFGTKIDYIKEDLSKNIFENKFIFIPDKNKNSTCGCGTSFTPY